MWEVWIEDHYIQGRLLKTFENKEAAVKFAKKHIKYKYLAPHRHNNKKKKEFFLEDENHMPVGMIIKRP